MKPTTKFQKEVVALSAQLPKIENLDIDWVKKNLFYYYSTKSRKTTYCLECGHTWKDDESRLTGQLLGHNCTECNSRLKLVDHNGDFTQTAYYSVITTKDNFQIQRVFCVYKHMKKKKEAIYFVKEIAQHWVRGSDGKKMGLYMLQSQSYYADYWQGSLEVRAESSYGNSYASYHKRDKNRLDGLIYPKKKILPVIKRNGFKNNFHGISPHNVFSVLINNNFAETALKTNQIELFKAICNSGKDMHTLKPYLPAIKTCIKNNYIIKEFSDWKDMVYLLMDFGRDIRNPKYVCPIDLKKEHDRLVEKKRMIARKQKLQELKSKMKDWESSYKKEKSKYFDLEFKEDNITITVLRTVKEFLYEKEAHRHCIFENEYFKKKNSLCFRAEVDGIQMESVEVNLGLMKVNQSRGKGNESTIHNKKILNLINKNMHLIKEAYFAKPKKKTIVRTKSKMDFLPIAV